MSADFIASYLELPGKNSSPNWQAAYSHIDSLSDGEVLQAINVARQTNIEETNSLLEEFGHFIGGSIKNYRRVLKKAVQECERIWNLGRVLTLSECCVLIVAGESWGDPIDGTDEITLMYESGAAHAAGFLGPERPVWGQNDSSEE